MIFEGDTQTPAAGSGETWPEAQLEAFAEALRTGTTLPDYMRIPGRSAGLLRKAQLLAGQARTLAGRMGGERYNTPSLARKMALVWANGTKTPITGTYLSEGTTPANSTWAVAPIPATCLSGKCSEQKQGENENCSPHQRSL